MISDQLVSFLPPSSNLAVLAAEVYSNVIDVLGVGAGITAAQANAIIGTATLPGWDPNVGVVVPEIVCAVGTAFATGAGATLTMKFEGAPDNGSGSPGTYKVYEQTPAMTAAQLTANSFFGRMKWPYEYPDGDNPRFFRLAFTPSAAFTAGTVAFALVTMGPWVNYSRYAAKNFTVAG